MGVKQYQLGKQHAEKNVPYMSHRHRQYDSKNAQRSYDNGYKNGKKK